MKNMMSIEKDVRALLARGASPAAYRLGLAEMHGVGVEVIDTAIAAIGGTPRLVHPEDAAQVVLAAERRAARQGGRESREYEHESE